MRAWALACVMLAGSGCGENAILELTIDLPPAATIDGADRRFAIVQPRTSSNPFTDEWPPGDLPPIELGADPIEDRVSVVTEDTSLDVHFKVRFCRTDDCTALGMGGVPGDDVTPEVWYLLEHPFYAGKRTSFHIEIPTMPAAPPAEPEVVDRCDIEGCITGTSITFCTSDDRHVCED